MSTTLPTTHPSDLPAILGGKPVIECPMPRPVRWGDPERAQLSAMIGQPSLFYWNGPQTKLLVERFREQYPFQHVMPCSSGTAALHIAVAAAGIGPGDEVITSPVTDMGTVIGVLYQQGVPVFADLEPHRYMLDPADVRRRITPRTRAIIAVHLCGNPSTLRELREIADEHGLVLIEDCAQAWGALYQGKPVGTIGHIACYSLNDFKHIGCGDGGIVASNEERFGKLFQRCGDKAYDRVAGGRDPEFLAPNYRISEPQSAVAAVQLTRLPAIAAKRARLGTLLGEKLRDIPGVVPHAVDPRDRCSFWFYLFRIQPEKFRCDRTTLVKAMAAEGAPCSEGYIPVPLYRYPVFQNQNFFGGRWPVKEFGLTTMDYRTVRLPEVEAILATCVRSEIKESMDEAYIEKVAMAIGKVVKYYSK
ncbi:MAG: DegT/DnrJ/EryC1/StrS family aminotransferase [Verrucomicrobiia bacterium]